jgi:predicted RNA-binding protein with PIN domain
MMSRFLLSSRSCVGFVDPKPVVFCRRNHHRREKNQRRRVDVVVVVASSSKKNKKNKKSDGGGGGGGGGGGEQNQPQRITGKKNGMSVHAQIRLVDRWKNSAKNNNAEKSELTSLTGPNAASKKSTTIQTTQQKANAKSNQHVNDAYQAELKRRRVLAAEKREKEREAYLRKTALDANDASLGAFFDSSSKKTKCFVDGYNVCGVPDEDDARMRVSGKSGSGGGIPHLRRRFLVEGDLDGARKILVEKVKAFAISRNMECVIVWDNNNYHTNNSGSSNSSSNSSTGLSEKERAEDIGDGVTVVFTGNGQLADGYIERETKLLAEEKDGKNVYVVTSDNAVRMAVSSANARVIDSGNFCREIRDTERDEDAILRELALDARWGGGAKQNKASIGASVLGDASAREKMMKLREMARNSSKAEMNEKLVGKSGSFGRFKRQNNTATKATKNKDATTTTTNKKEASDGEGTNVTKRLLMRRARMDENANDDDRSSSSSSSSSSGQRWGSF